MPASPPAFQRILGLPGSCAANGPWSDAAPPRIRIEVRHSKFTQEAVMAFNADEIRANRDYFAHKLRAEKQRNDVLHAVEGETFDFVLLDTRGREPFAGGHIPGALCAPLEEL